MPLDFITRTYCFLAPVNLMGIIPILTSLKFETIDDEEEDSRDDFCNWRIINIKFTLSFFTINNNMNYYKIIVNNNQLSSNLMSRKTSTNKIIIMQYFSFMKYNK